MKCTDACFKDSRAQRLRRLVAAGAVLVATLGSSTTAAFGAAPVAPSAPATVAAPMPAPPGAGNNAAKPPTSASADKEERIRTQFTPRNEVVISSELSARIASLSLREGDAFTAGQTLVTFDCSLFQAQLGKARASLDTARQALVIQTRLAELNSAGALDVQQAQGRANEGAAEVAYMQAMVSRCAIQAPFTGRIAKRLAAGFQYVTPGTPLLGLIDTKDLELQLIVPSRWLTWLKVGSRFQVQVDELGTSVTARVVRLGARIDPVSQTASLSGVVDGSAANLLPGMGGWATFPAAASR